MLSVRVNAVSRKTPNLPLSFLAAGTRKQTSVSYMLSSVRKIHASSSEMTILFSSGQWILILLPQVNIFIKSNN